MQKATAALPAPPGNETLSDNIQAETKLSTLVAASAMCLLALWCIVTSLLVVYNAYSLQPNGDIWDYWNWYIRHRGHLIVSLFEFHNEHRIALPRLILMADQFFGRAHGAIPLTITFLLQICHSILLTGAMVAHRRYPTLLRLFSIGLALTLLTAAMQFTNLVFPFQVQFVAVYFFATASIMAIAVPGWKPFAISALSAMCAILSMANGLLVLPFLVAGIYFVRRSWQLACAAAVCSLLIIYLYVSGIVVNKDSHSMAAGALYSFAVLGSPVQDLIGAFCQSLNLTALEWKAGACIIVGLGGCIAAALQIAHILDSTDLTRRDRAVRISVLLFPLISVFLIGWGRSSFSITTALESRYTTPALLFWGTLMTGWVLETPSRLRLVTTLIVAMLVVGIHQAAKIENGRVYHRILRDAEVSSVTGVFSRDSVQALYWNPEGLIKYTEFLRVQGLGPFSQRWTSWIGRRFPAPIEGPCLGSIDHQDLAKSFRPGTVLNGWAYNSRFRDPLITFVATEGDIVIGFGNPGYTRPDLPYPGHVGWTGYLRPIRPQAVKAYLVDGGLNSACLAGQTWVGAVPPLP